MTSRNYIHRVGDRVIYDHGCHAIDKKNVGGVKTRNGWMGIVTKVGENFSNGSQDTVWVEWEKGGRTGHYGYNLRTAILAYDPTQQGDTDDDI